MAKISVNLADEAVAIAQFVGVNVDEIKDKGDARLVLAAEVASQYARIDEILAEIIVRYFFGIEPDVLHFEKAWKTEKFKIFVHHILDEMVQLKKLSIVRAIGPVPNEVSKTELMPFVVGSLTASFPRTGRKIALPARSSMRAPISSRWMNCASSRTTQTPLTDISMTDCMDQLAGRISQRVARTRTRC
jgi:hypothetical protein